MSKKNKGESLASDIIGAFLEGAFEGDMKSLRNAINNSADEVIDDVSKQLKKAYNSSPQNLSSHRENYKGGSYTQKRQEKLYEERKLRLEEERKRQEEARKRQEELRKNRNNRREKSSLALGFPMNPVGSVSSVVLKVVGITGMSLSGISILTSLPALIAGNVALGSAIFSLGVFAAFTMLTGKGFYDSKRLDFAKRIAGIVGSKAYIELDDLASISGNSKKKLSRQLKKLFKLGFFPQGHIDSENTTLMLTDQVYGQYMETKENALRLAVESKEKAQKELEDASSKYPTLSPKEAGELEQMVADGKGYVVRLHELNDRIPGEVITDKLYKLEQLLREIFDNIQKHPEQMSKMHELMDYYLPTMIKLVEAYEEYDKVSAPGKDIIKAKEEIEITLDTINDAFKKLLNNLFKDSVYDVTTDAMVLTSMLKQKGLASDMTE